MWMQCFELVQTIPCKDIETSVNDVIWFLLCMNHLSVFSYMAVIACRVQCTTSRLQWLWPSLQSQKVCRPSSQRVWRSAPAEWRRRTLLFAVCRPSKRSVARRSSAPTRREPWPPTRCQSAGWVSVLPWPVISHRSVMGLSVHLSMHTCVTKCD